MKCDSKNCDGQCAESEAFRTMTREEWVAHALAAYGR